MSVAVFCDANEKAHLDSDTCHLDLSKNVRPPVTFPSPIYQAPPFVLQKWTELNKSLHLLQAISPKNHVSNFTPPGVRTLGFVVALLTHLDARLCFTAVGHKEQLKHVVKATICHLVNVPKPVKSMFQVTFHPKC